MNCPVCAVQLIMSERQGIEIDYCPTCRGVWLDRGELDKIIERSSIERKPVEQDHSQNRLREEHKSHHKEDHHGYSKHKRRSFLEDLFD
jgi:Zn-finger nucleic acid-binding protein